ncbi:MAG: nickel-dependent lactate racemase [Armatimonadota bacterium]
MHIPLAYGKTGLTITLPDDARVTVVEPKHTAGVPDPITAIRQAVQHPIASPSLAEFVKPSDTVGIIFSDITRPTPNHLIIPVLREELQHIPDERIILFNATGTHRPNTEAELRGMLGDEMVNRYRIVQHHAEDNDAHVLVGTTASGNEIRLERSFVECDARILTGFIEPHFFAGFSGGGKAVMPGLASLETVQRNHSAMNIDSPLARWGITRGNPLWQEVYEAAMMVAPTFLVNVTLNRSKEITGVFAGDLTQAHAAGCASVKERAMVPVPAAFDIVIGTNSGYPLDLNLYQTVKGMSAAAQVVKPDGSIIIAADCWDGLPDNSAYARLLNECQNPDILLSTIRTAGFNRPEMWQAQVQALICQHADVYVHSHNLTDTQITGAHIKPCRSIEDTVAGLLERYGPDAAICVLPQGPQTVPFIV